VAVSGASSSISSIPGQMTDLNWVPVQVGLATLV
jgi:hypothetical protein